jgi:8-oxo-dGTP diphosphatase
MNHEEWVNSIERVGVIAGCVIKHDGKYLLVQEKQSKAYGLWNLPAGHVDKGETLEDAARRETKEESGFEVKIVGEIGVFHDSAKEAVKHAYIAQIVGGKLTIQPNEILDAKWLTYQEIADLNNDHKIRASWIWESITRAEKSGG